MNIKTVGSTAAAVMALGIVGSTGVSASSPPDLPDEIVIGAPLDTSGSAAIATVGTDELNGMQLAAAEVNESGFLGDSKLTIDFVDTQAAKEVAVQAVIEMTTSDPVDAIVGFSLTPSFQAAGPIAQDAEIPVIAVGLSGTGVTEVGDYVFRVYPALVDLYARTDQQIIEALGAETAAYFYSQDSSNVAEQHEFRRALLEDLGIETVAAEGITTDAIDYQPQLTTIAAADPDVLVVNLNGGQDPTFLAQYAQAGLDVPMMVDIGFGAPDVVADPIAQCAIFVTTWDVRSEVGTNAAFVAAYEAEYGKPPSQYAAWGYDGVWLYAAAVRQAGTTDPEAVRDALGSLEGFAGALGEYGFDENRSPTQSGVILQIVDGAAVPWTPDSTCER